MSDQQDPRQARYHALTNQAVYEGWRASRPRGTPLPDPDPYLCDHGVVGGFYINPATGRPGCPFCRARPAMVWRAVQMSSPLPGTIRHRAEPA